METEDKPPATEQPPIFIKQEKVDDLPEIAYEIINAPKIKMEVVQNPDIYSCPTCQKQFRSDRNLQVHMQTHLTDLEKPYACEVCNTRFKVKYNIPRHLKRLHPHVASDYHCNICQTNFIRKADAQFHQPCHLKKENPTPKQVPHPIPIPIPQNLLTISDNSCYSCQFCDYTFSSETSLNIHISQAHKTENHQSQTELINHKRKYTDTGQHLHKCPKRRAVKQGAGPSEKSRGKVKAARGKLAINNQTIKSWGRVCHICNLGFHTKHRLYLHLQTHGEDNYTCNICNSKFNTQVILNSHLLSHSGIRYSCNICFVHYIDKSGLRNHMREHSVENNFICIFCKEIFQTNGKLEVHMLKHKDVPECCVCNYKFNSITRFKYHMKEHNGGKTYTCTLCDLSYTTKFVLDTHLNTHTSSNIFICEICGTTFDKRSEFLAHIRKHKDVHFTCNICRRNFASLKKLQEHGVRHNQEQYHSCPICEAKFLYKKVLKKHVRSHLDSSEPELNSSSNSDSSITIKSEPLEMPNNFQFIKTEIKDDEEETITLHTPIAIKREISSDNEEDYDESISDQQSNFPRIQQIPNTSQGSVNQQDQPKSCPDSLARSELVKCSTTTNNGTDLEDQLERSSNSSSGVELAKIVLNQLPNTSQELSGSDLSPKGTGTSFTSTNNGLDSEVQQEHSSNSLVPIELSKIAFNQFPNSPQGLEVSNLDSTSTNKDTELEVQ